MHEIFNDAVELGALVAVAKFGARLVLPSRQCSEVLDGLWDGLWDDLVKPRSGSKMRRENIHHRTNRSRLAGSFSLSKSPACSHTRLTSSQFLVAMFDIKVDLVSDLGALRGVYRLRAEKSGKGY